MGKQNDKPNAGNYPFRFLWLRATRTEDGTTGDRPKTYAPAGFLWGAVSLDSASEETDFGAVRATKYGTVTVRNWPAVSALDRLYWGRFSDLLVIDGVRQDFARNETILDVHSLGIGVTFDTGSGGAAMGGTVGL